MTMKNKKSSESNKNQSCGVKKSQPSGAQNRKKKKKEQEIIKSQGGSIFKYVKKVGESSNANEGINTQEDISVNDVCQNKENMNRCPETHQDDTEIQEENKDQDEEEGKQQKDVSFDDSEPATWGNVDTKVRDLLVRNSPMKRLSSDYRFPKDKIGRHFSHTFYTRELINGERQDRRWLIYTKASDKAFCFLL